MLKLITKQSRFLLLVFALGLIPAIVFSQDTTNFLSKFKTSDSFNWLDQRNDFYLNDNGITGDSLTDRYIKGLEQIDAGNYEEAIILFKSTKGVEKLNIDSWKSDKKYQPDFMIGICYRLLSEKDSALFYYRKSIHDDPGNEEYYLEIGRLYAELNEDRTCLKYCDSAIEINPNSTDAFYLKSYIYYRKGRIKASAKQIDKALDIDPDNVYFNMLLGEIYRYRKKDEKAIKYYQTAVEKDSTLSYAYQQIGLCYFNMHNSNSSVAALKKAIQIDTSNSGNYFILGLIYMYKNLSRTDGMDNLVKSIEIDKQDSIYYYGQDVADIEFKELIYELGTNDELHLLEKKSGYLLLQLYLGDNSRNPYTQLLTLDTKLPSSVFIGRILNYITYVYYGNRVKSDYLVPILMEEPDLLTVNVMSANCYYYEEKYDWALKKLNLVTGRVPFFYEALMIKAEVLIELERFQEVFQVLDSIDELRPNQIVTSFLRSMAYFETGFHRQALNRFIIFNEDNNETDEYNYLDIKIAECYYELGMIDSAGYYAEIACSDRNHSYGGAYLIRGKVNLEKGDLHLADKDFSSAIYKTNSREAEPYYYRGLVNKKKGYNRKAVEDFKDAIVLDDANAEAYYELALCYYNLKKYRLAIKYGNDALLKKSNYFDAMYLVSLAELRSGNVEDAEYYYLKYAKRNIDYNNSISANAYAGLQNLIDNDIMYLEAKSIFDQLKELED